MRNITTQFDRQFLITAKGTICSNCNKDCQQDIIFHHVVPIVLGGQDVLTNIVPLCESCHNLIHHGSISENKNFSHSDLIKVGIEKRKAQGLPFGRPVMTKEDLPQSFLEYYQKIKQNQITITQTARELSLSRTTVYKYITLIENT